MTGKIKWFYVRQDFETFTKPSKQRGELLFLRKLFGYPCPTSGKNHAAPHACGRPSRPETLVRYPTKR